MFTSNLGGSIVYDDSNAHELITEIQDPSTPYSGGYVERDYAVDGFTTSYSGATFPRSEWEERIRDLEAAEATLTHTHERSGCEVLDQNGLNYCWMYGVAGAMQVSYAKTGGKVPYLSATSAAAKGKNYRNVGGWGKEAIGYIERFGMSTIEHWPEHALDRRYDTAEQRENAKLHAFEPRIGFEELRSNSFDQLVSALLMRWPVTMGLNWWGHLVFGLRPVVIERGSFGVEIMNSWGIGWKNRGKAVLREDKATAFEQIAIKNLLPL